jgi:DNA-binding CsgD family transcriptional regulator
VSNRHHYTEAADIAGDIIEYAGEGNSPEEIARELGVAVASVRKVLEEACQNAPS